MLIVVVTGFVVWNSAGWALRALGVPIAGLFPTGWGSRSGLFPLVIGLPTFLLAIAQLVVAARRPPGAGVAGIGGEAALDVPAETVRQRSIVILATIVGFAVAIWLVGFFVAIPLVTFLYLRFGAGESWGLSTGLSVATLVVFYVLFDVWLHIPMPLGLLLEPVLG